jgi:hypothetical protein
MVTATHDRRRDPHAGVNALQEWGERSAFGTAKGWPWWAAVILALGLSIVGAFIDMHVSGNLGKVFEGGYFLGCVGAVCLVRRRNLFGPMVQAPLILAVTIPVVVLLTKGMPSGSGTMSKLLTLGVPLVTGFPTMAITTIATLVIGGIRFLVQRKPATDDVDGDDRDDSGPADRDEPRRRPADRDGERGERPATASRPRPAGGSGRPTSSRTPRDDREGARDRARAPQSSRGRGEPSGREGSSGRSASGRSTQDRDRDRGRDPESRERRPARERAPGTERGQAPRSGQSRDRGQAPRGDRPSRDEGRRQPPPRRRDDDY